MDRIKGFISQGWKDAGTIGKTKGDKAEVTKKKPAEAKIDDSASIKGNGVRTGKVGKQAAALNAPTYKKVKKETAKGLLQNKGVIESSKKVIEESVPELKPGQIEEQKSRPRPRTLEKEVKLKSGVTIHEDTKNHTVTISRNDGNGNPQTLAVLNDASLQVPQESPGKNWASMFGVMVGEKTAATYEDVIIRNQNMKQAIKPDGTIVIEDQKRGGVETPATLNKPGVSAFGIIGSPTISSLNKWQGDRYTITPDGKVKSEHFRTKHTYSSPPPSKTLNYMSGIYTGTEAERIPGNAKLKEDGSIEAAKGEKRVHPDSMLKTAGEILLIKPFVTHKQVNTMPPPKDLTSQPLMTKEGFEPALKEDRELAHEISTGQLNGPNSDGKFDFDKLLNTTIEKYTDKKTGEINSRAVFMELFD